MADFYYRTFGGFSPDEMTAENSQVYILPLPYECSTCYVPGTKFGPNAIIDASPFMEFYDGELDYDAIEKGIKIHTCCEAVLSRRSMEDAMAEIFEISSRLVKKEIFLITLGGEHSITPPIVRSFAEKYNSLSVLQFDAHSDLRDSYEGTRHSHACAMRRAREFCDSVVQVGIRSMGSEEAAFIKEAALEPFIYRAQNRKNWDIDQMMSQLSDNVYISFDLDGLDPSIMPAVGTPEPGGMLWYDTLSILRKCFETKNVVGCDVVELMPLQDSFHASFTAASLVYKMISYKFFESFSIK